MNDDGSTWGVHKVPALDFNPPALSKEGHETMEVVGLYGVEPDRNVE
jgi:hypothetical protein